MTCQNISSLTFYSVFQTTTTDCRWKKAFVPVRDSISTAHDRHLLDTKYDVHRWPPRIHIPRLFLYLTLQCRPASLGGVGAAPRRGPIPPGLVLHQFHLPCASPIDPPEWPTLTQAFFSPECADAWVARGTLFSKITQGPMAQRIRDSLKLSVLYTWVNGSDERLRAWKEALAKNQEVDVQYGRKIPGYAARHFRYDPLLFSL